MLERADHRFAVPEEIVQNRVHRKRLGSGNINKFNCLDGW